MVEESVNTEATQIGLHSVRNLLGEQNQRSLFSEQDQDYAEEFDIALSGKIERFGIDLSDTESRVMEGILYGFSATSYRGNLDSTTPEKLAKERYSGKIPESYKYVNQIPRLRATQSEILEWAGINKGSIASWARAIEALKDLGTKQYCFFYDRLAFDDDGIPIKDRHGRWKKEEVIAVDSLFTIKEVRSENGGPLKYYEITPSAIFLDQRESYFMLVPYNWREEVKSLYGPKKASSYTFRFLLFLRYQYELKRRSNQKKPFQIRWSPEEIAAAIKMPDSVIQRKKKRVREILDDAYSVAKKLNYLVDFDTFGHVDVLTLNDEKFFNPKDLSVNHVLGEIGSDRHQMEKDAKELFQTFHALRRSLDKAHKTPDVDLMVGEIEYFTKLRKARSKEEIHSLMQWAIGERFWCSRLSTPAKFFKHFSEAWSEMVVATKAEGLNSPENHQKFALRLQKQVAPVLNGLVFEVLNTGVEIGNGVHQPTCIAYEDPKFRDKVLRSAKRWGIPLPEKDCQPVLK